jgi:hypothetical protein
MTRTRSIQGRQHSRRGRRREAALLLILILLAGCGGSDKEDPQHSQAADTATWRLADPTVVIGGTSDPAHQLHRVYGALLASDGSIVVGNSGTGEVRFFDSRGAHRTTSGREGSGPGEYRSINWLGPWGGDSVLAYDLRARRFSVVGPDGRFARSFQLPPAAGSAIPAGTFPGGSILLVQETHFDPRRQTGLVRDTLVLVRITPAGEVVDTVGRLPGAEWLLYEHTASFRSTQLPFGHAGHVAVTGNEIVYAPSHANELSVFDTTGALVRKIRIPAESRRLSDDEQAAYVDEIVQDAAEAEAIRRHLDGAGPRTAPLIGSLRAGRDGTLWVQLFPPAGSDTAKWVAMTPDGRAAGSVRLPAAVLPLDLHPRALLLRERDADGVERVTLRQVGR